MPLLPSCALTLLFVTVALLTTVAWALFQRRETADRATLARAWAAQAIDRAIGEERAPCRGP